MKRRFAWIVLMGLLVTGITCLSYPYLCEYQASQAQAAVIDHYDTTTQAMDAAEKAEQLEAAKAYNAQLSAVTGDRPFDPLLSSGQDYNTLLDVGDGVMGSLEIPKIRVNLPIYHGTTSDTLAKGAGHLKESSLPIGGEGTHSVLSSHTGYSKAKLFTDLDQLEKGDRFYIHVLAMTLVYEVDQIQEVAPEDTSWLKPTPGKDYVTLLTCTPYGINSHRLLVRGSRVTESDEVVTQENAKPSKQRVMPLVATTATLLTLSFGIWQWRKQTHGHKSDKGGNHNE